MRQTLVCALLLGVYSFNIEELFERDPDDSLDFLGMCNHHGYEAEAHEVTTPDGYILTVHHIIGKEGGPMREYDPNKVVFM